MFNRDQLADAIRYEGGVSRRLFFAYTAALAAIPQLQSRAEEDGQKPAVHDNPFKLGVASGDPDATSVILWTRLSREPLEIDGGLKSIPFSVHWELADDEGFHKIVDHGKVVATPALGHAVHVEVKNLSPDRWYFYRFQTGDFTSPVGRTRTLPAADAKVDKLRMAFASCQHYEHGYFSAYAQMIRDEPDLVFHLGDYIYEGGGTDNKVRKHIGKEIKNLEDYRRRYAQYRSDRLLQTTHAVCPWFVTWDDHEVDNNYAGHISEEKEVRPEDFLLRRAAAYQAYYENMPLRPTSVPKGPDLMLYRHASFGRLAKFCILDTRQYRSDQPNGDKASPLNEAAYDKKATLLGKKQREWLQKELIASQGTWNVLAQQVMMGQVGFDRTPEQLTYSMDQWPGYSHERNLLVKFLQEQKIANPVVLTGDIHANWANELRVDDRRPETPVVATEFVGTSITSGGNGALVPKNLDRLYSHNPFVKFHSVERGYVRCEITPKTWTTDFVATTDVLKPGGKSETRMSMVVEAGEAGIKRG
jgi:alkaline phosphatase D